ncbi:alanine racemase [Longibacter salinarum]|uniref:Alanine racemase n=1 Tax=Longibacter salinarum TaxID=1850348 RepID=A0A2A8D0E7_9BACT|nr:alanine racemase [Longibacter salinarum]PEN14406.1 alanine racemase [Longibacter salinarum]
MTGDVPAAGSSVYAEIDLAAIRSNTRLLMERAAPAQLMAVVKADAYSHGATQIAPVLEQEGVAAFAVARPTEGVELREAGITTRILVLGAPLPGDLPVCAHHDLDVTVSSLEVAERVRDYARVQPLRVHLKVDTGMSRLGVSPEDVSDVYRTLQKERRVTVGGVWTHFATADAPGHPLTATQRERFDALRRELDLPLSFHTDNTGALLTGDGTLPSPEGPASQTYPSYVRTGIAVYGLAPTSELSSGEVASKLRPALALRARVTHLHTIDAGTSVSYGATWTADRPTRIATLGAGYADGYPRLGSGSARVRIGDELRPVVGTICMDMCMVDLGPPDSPLARRVEVGNAATLFGPDGPTIYDVARWARTIPYEICCGLSRRVPRIYTDGEDSEDEANR